MRVLIMSLGHLTSFLLGNSRVFCPGWIVTRYQAMRPYDTTDQRGASRHVSTNVSTTVNDNCSACGSDRGPRPCKCGRLVIGERLAFDRVSANFPDPEPATCRPLASSAGASASRA